jgi:hypothetical protein
VSSGKSRQDREQVVGRGVVSGLHLGGCLRWEALGQRLCPQRVRLRGRAAELARVCRAAAAGMYGRPLVVGGGVSEAARLVWVDSPGLLAGHRLLLPC